LRSVGSGNRHVLLITRKETVGRATCLERTLGHVFDRSQQIT
jgi:hypothetical protein